MPPVVLEITVDDKGSPVLKRFSGNVADATGRMEKTAVNTPITINAPITINGIDPKNINARF